MYFNSLREISRSVHVRKKVEGGEKEKEKLLTFNDSSKNVGKLKKQKSTPAKWTGAFAMHNPGPSFKCQSYRTKGYTQW